MLFLRLWERTWIWICLALSLPVLVGCSAPAVAAPDVEIASVQETSVVATGTLLPPTPTHTPTPTPSPTATPIPTPTSTPTPRLFVEAGTPLPLPLRAISANSAASVSGLAVWQQDYVSDLAWIPGSPMVAASSFDRVYFYDLETRTRLRTLYPRSEGIFEIAVGPNRSWLVAGSRLGSEIEGYASNLELWRGPDWKPVGILYGVQRRMSDLAFSPNGQTLAVAYASPEIVGTSLVEFWDVPTWTVVRELRMSTVLNVAFSADGVLMATTPHRYAIRIFDLDKRGELRLEIPTSFTGMVNSLIFSPDGGQLVTGHYDGFIRVWDTNSGDLLRTMESTGVVESLAFSPDGDLLASGHSYDIHLIRLWSFDTGTLLRELEGHESAVTQLRFSPDAQALASGSYQGELRLWGIRP